MPKGFSKEGTNKGWFKKGSIPPPTAWKKGNVPWIKGKRHSKEVKERLSKAHLGQVSWNKGKKLTKEHKKKLSEAKIRKIKEGNYKPILNMKGKHIRKGESNNMWRGGITSLNKLIRDHFKYRQWRSDIFTRDNFTCQTCNVRGGFLEADHHPKKFSEIMKEYKIISVEQALSCDELWNINNGRTLCQKCHRPWSLKLK